MLGNLENHNDVTLWMIILTYPDCNYFTKLLKVLSF